MGKTTIILFAVVKIYQNMDSINSKLGVNLNLLTYGSAFQAYIINTKSSGTILEYNTIAYKH